MADETIINRFARWLDGQMTREEETAFLLELEHLSSDEWYALLDEDALQFTPQEARYFTESDRSTMLARIFEQRETEQVNVAVSSEPGKVRPLFRRWRIAAAIAGGLLIGAAYYIYSTHGNRNTPEIAKTKTVMPDHDALPGGNKAILTLSNGSTIILDSVRIGSLTSQGNANIAKTDSGRLAYNRSGGKAPVPEVMYNTVSTPRGGQYELALADGTKVWLNAASSIRFPVLFNGNERSVEVTGEVYFEVAHNEKQPFKVRVGEQTIEDIGTSFNINAYADEGAVKTTLIEGAVKISDKQHAVVLKPGDQAIAGKQQIQVKQNVDIEQVMAWKNGLFAFRSAGLPTILRQLSRWYDVDVVYDGAIPERHITGKIGKTLTLDQVLRSLTQLRVHYTIEGKKLTIRKE